MMITVAMTEEMALLSLRLASPILGRDWGTSGTSSYPLLKLDMDFHSTRLNLHAANEGPRLPTAESLGVLRSVRPPTSTDSRQFRKSKGRSSDFSIGPNCLNTLASYVKPMGWSLGRRFTGTRDRDRDFILGLDLKTVNNILWPLLVGFVCLEFLDVYSTLIALSQGQFFMELNPIAGTLFSMKFIGFLLALALKYLPTIPLFYLVFAGDKFETHPYEIRLVKFVAPVSLIAADSLLLYIVALNNLPLLFRSFMDGLPAK